MIRRCTRLLLVAAFLCSMGMPAAVLQMAAWAKMTAAFARHDSLGVSIGKTFDGRHPCALCCALKKAAEPQSLSAAPSYSRLAFVPPTASPRAGRRAVAWPLASSSALRRERAPAPPAPPPEAVLA